MFTKLDHKFAAFFAAVVAGVFMMLAPSSASAMKPPPDKHRVLVPVAHAHHAHPVRHHGLPACREEDGSGQHRCAWDAKREGNGVGRSYVVTNGGTRRQHVHYVSEHRAHHLIHAWAKHHNHLGK